MKEVEEETIRLPGAPRSVVVGPLASRPAVPLSPLHYSFPMSSSFFSFSVRFRMDVLIVLEARRSPLRHTRG